MAQPDPDKMYGGRIRVIVLGIIRRGDQILVFQGQDPVKGITFYRPLGGGVEWGERSEEALAREFREELGAELTGIRPLGVLENIFNYQGREGHEVVFVYEAAFADPAFYERERLPAYEEAAGEFEAIWMPLAEFKNGKEILFSEGLSDLLD